MASLIRNGVLMARQKEIIDEHGVKWVTSARVAEIWNERAEDEKGVTGRYSRWSVYQRREDFKKRMSTPNGDLFLESEALSIPIHPHPAPRTDITNTRKGKKKHEFSKSAENSSQNP